MLTNQSIGYMDAPVPKDLDLKEAIDKLRKEKNAIILAHYYQTGDIQDIADYVGDSLAWSQWAANDEGGYHRALWGSLYGRDGEDPLSG